MGSAKISSFVLCTALTPPFWFITKFTALQILSSSTPTARILWLSCATDDAIAPFFKPKFLINPFAMGAFLYLFITIIFKKSSAILLS